MPADDCVEPFRLLVGHPFLESPNIGPIELNPNYLGVDVDRTPVLQDGSDYWNVLEWAYLAEQKTFSFLFFFYLYPSLANYLCTVIADIGPFEVQFPQMMIYTCPLEVHLSQ